jgi:CRISPR-associated protein (TIGR02584 family)
MRSERPHSYARRILVTVAGVTPQIITETIYALITQDPAFVPTEVHVFTTEVGAQLFLESEDIYCRLFNQHYRSVFEAHGLTLGKVKLQGDQALVTLARPGIIDTYIHVLSGPFGRTADIRTPEDNERVAGFIMRAVLEFTSDDAAAIHASIAGGRRTMGFYLGYLMSMFGRDQDRLSQVLVDNHCANTPEFFFPLPAPVAFTTRNGIDFVPGPASVLLSNIPFIRHRSGFADADLRRPGMTFSHAVSIAQRSIPTIELAIDIARRLATVGGQVVHLKDNPLSWLLWFAEERRNYGSGGITCRSSPAGFLDCYARILNEEASLKWDATNDALKQYGFTPTDFRNRVSTVNRALRAALGAVPAAPYIIATIGKKRQGEERAYALSLPGSAIVIRD